MTDLIKRAIYFAAEKHDKQYRKGTNVPYFAHPVLVAMEVSKYSEDEDIIAAAFLHDVIEDCSVGYTELQKLFSKRIAKIVKELSFSTGGDKKISWRDKKKVYLKKVKKASEEALVIVAADKMNNMRSYFDAVISGVDVGKLFRGDLSGYLWYYGKILEILKSRMSRHPITSAYQKTLESYRVKLTQSRILLD